MIQVYASGINKKKRLLLFFLSLERMKRVRRSAVDDSRAWLNTGHSHGSQMDLSPYTYRHDTIHMVPAIRVDVQRPFNKKIHPAVSSSYYSYEAAAFTRLLQASHHQRLTDGGV